MVFMDRRSFFRVGQGAPLTAWEDFCYRLQKTLNIPLNIVSDGDFCAAEMCIDHLAHIQLIHRCCKGYNVGVALHGFASAETVMARHMLFVAFSDGLNGIEPVGEHACIVQPSVLVGDLLEKGYRQFARVPPETKVVEWFADPAYHDCRPLHDVFSGVESISATFSDGSQAVIGQLYDPNQYVQADGFLGHCVVELFELLADADVEKQLQSDYWCCDYRIDALSKRAVGMNLARVLLGHQGRLAWVQQLLIQQVHEDVLRFPSEGRKPKSFDTMAVIYDINTRVKNIFDESGIFLYDDELIRDAGVSC